MKRIRIHSSRYIAPLKVQGPILSIIEVSDTVYDSIVRSGHTVELVETKQKAPKINKTVLQSLEIKPKNTIIEIKEEEIKEEHVLLEQEKEEKIEEIKKPIFKTQLTNERIVNRFPKNNKRRRK